MSFDSRLLTGIGVLAAVTEAGNFARAAEIVGLTPSGVSRAIARLEARIGVRLFDRGPRAVTLTEEGRRFHTQVTPLLAGLEEAATDAAGAATVVSGRLRASIDPWFNRAVLAPALPGFLAAHPRLQLEISSSNYREEMMTGIDVAVRFGPAEAGSLIARKLLDSPVVTVAAPGYLARRGTPKAPRDLVDHDCLLFRDPQTSRPFPWEFHRKGKVVTVPVAGRLVMDDPSAAIAACAAGLGLFQGLRLGLDDWLASGRLRQVLTGWADERYPLYAYHPSRHLPPAKVRAFLAFIQQVAAASSRI